MNTSFSILIIFPLMALLLYPSDYTLVAFLFVLISSVPFFVAGAYSDRIGNELQPITNTFYVVGCVSGLINISYVVSNLGFSLLDLFTLEGFISIAKESTYIRYIGDTSANSGNPYLLAISLWLIFRVAISGGKVSTFRKIFPITLVFIYTLITTEKWPSYLAIAFYFSGLAYKQQISELSQQMLKHWVLLISIPFFMLLAMSLRGSESAFSIEELRGLFVYLVGGFHGLGVFLSDIYDFQKLTFGEMTFIGPISFFTDKERAAGVYSESFYLNNSVSNIYSSYRYLVNDFGFFSPVILNCFLAVYYVICIKIRAFSFGNIIRFFVIISAFLSINTTLFVHNSVFLGFILCCITIGFEKRTYRYSLS